VQVRSPAGNRTAQFKDLNESLECVPAVELGDRVAITKRAYDWVDSVS
jgi:hypothetical protein